MSVHWGATKPLFDSEVGFREGPNNENPYGPAQGIRNAAYCCSYACTRPWLAGVRWRGRQFGAKGDAYCPFQITDHQPLVRYDHASKGDPADLLPGDQVFFSWNNNGTADHIETVVAVFADGTFDTNGANTGSPNGVWIQRRDRRYLLARLRPGYQEAFIDGGVCGALDAVPDPIPSPPVADKPQLGDRLVADQRLYRGQSLWSADGKVELAMQGDGNLVLYSHIGRQHVLWATNKPGDFVTLQRDGNLVVYRGRDVAWALNREAKVKVPNAGNALVVQADRNLVLYGGRAPVWATGTQGR